MWISEFLSIPHIFKKSKLLFMYLISGFLSIPDIFKKCKLLFMYLISGFLNIPAIFKKLLFMYLIFKKCLLRLSGLSIFRENPVIAERLQSLFIHGTKCGHFNTFFEYWVKMWNMCMMYAITRSCCWFCGWFMKLVYLSF